MFWAALYPEVFPRKRRRGFVKPGELRRCCVPRTDTHVCLPNENYGIGRGKWSYLEQDDVVFVLDDDVRVPTYDPTTQLIFHRRFVKFLSRSGIMFRFYDFLEDDTKPLLT
jgi:hypothetical protein